jgi:hypothetical protein
MLLPLRAVHARLVAGGSARSAADDAAWLGAGVELLLRISKASLLELPDNLRRRLFELGCNARLASDAAVRRGLLALFHGIAWRDARARGQAALSLVGALLAAGAEPDARKLLADGPFEGEAGVDAKHWLKALDGPRLGPIAFDPPGGRGGAARQGGGPASAAARPASSWRPSFITPRRASGITGSKCSTRAGSR